MSRRENCLFSGLIASLSLALDLEENRKLYHAWRVALVSWPMAKVIIPQKAGIIFYGALLHDIGAMGMADHIVHLAFSGHDDLKEVFLHPIKGSEIIKKIPGLQGASQYVLEHHEKWDGTGYPQKLKGEKISLGGQIIAAADLFDVIIRRNKQATLKAIVSKVKNYVGEFISPQVFSVLQEVAETKLYQDILIDDALEDLMKDVLKEVPPPSEELNNIIPTTSALAAVIDAKHKYTAGHSRRVALYGLEIGKQLGLNADEMEKLQIAGLLHDLGKIGVPRSILDKTAPLTEREFEIIKGHPQGTIDILSMVEGLKDIAYIAGAHHERVDGQGYPYGFVREEIPFSGRILAVADAFDAITSNRPYQPTRNKDEAIKILNKNSSSQFDTIVVEAATEALKTKKLID